MIQISTSATLSEAGATEDTSTSSFTALPLRAASETSWAGVSEARSENSWIFFHGAVVLRHLKGSRSFIGSRAPRDPTPQASSLKVPSAKKSVASTGSHTEGLVRFEFGDPKF